MVAGVIALIRLIVEAFKALLAFLNKNREEVIE
jgi:hypothetical protein